MKMQDTLLNMNSYPGTSCLPWWNGGFSLVSGLAQEKIINSEMANSNRVTDVDSICSHSEHDLDLSNSNFRKKCTSVQSGDENSNYATTKLDFQSKPTRSAASTEVLLSQQSIDFRQPFPCVSYTYAELYTGGMFHSYESHSMLNSSVSGLASPRVPLPRHPSDEELIYVNPKQYHGILRRRQLRAKLEAQRKLTRGRKAYLHESRHLHAMRRVRGSGGRFVNTKQNNQKATTNTPTQRSVGKCTSTTLPSSNVDNMFCPNQSNYFNQNNCSGHASYNSELSRGGMHHWVSTILPS